MCVQSYFVPINKTHNCSTHSMKYSSKMILELKQQASCIDSKVKFSEDFESNMLKLNWVKKQKNCMHVMFTLALVLLLGYSEYVLIIKSAGQFRNTSVWYSSMSGKWPRDTSNIQWGNSLLGELILLNINKYCPHSILQ